MKPARIFKQYIWLVNTLRKYRRLTLSELNALWQEDEVGDGNPLPRSTFNKYRDGIGDMFGLYIDCDTTYHYFISNPNELEGNQTMQWMLSTLTTGLTLNGNQNNVSGSAQNLVNAGIGNLHLQLIMPLA